MRLISLLNHYQHFPGFVYEKARHCAESRTIEISVRPRRGSRPVCSGCRRVAPGNLTPRPSQNRTYASRHIRLVSSTEGCRLPSGPAAPPVSRWPVALTQMTPSLRSVGITPPHRYYGGVRPSAPHRSSRLAVFAACASPFHIGATGSCSSARKPASASRPLYAGRRLPSNQAPDKLIPR